MRGIVAFATRFRTSPIFPPPVCAARHCWVIARRVQRLWLAPDVRRHRPHLPNPIPRAHAKIAALSSLLRADISYSSHVLRSGRRQR